MFCNVFAWILHEASFYHLPLIAPFSVAIVVTIIIMAQNNCTINEKTFFFCLCRWRKSHLTGFVIECRLLCKRENGKENDFAVNTGINSLVRKERNEWARNKFFSLHQAQSFMCVVDGRRLGLTVRYRVMPIRMTFNSMAALLSI